MADLALIDPLRSTLDLFKQGPLLVAASAVVFTVVNGSKLYDITAEESQATESNYAPASGVMPGRLGRLQRLRARLRSLPVVGKLLKSLDRNWHHDTVTADLLRRVVGATAFFLGISTLGMATLSALNHGYLERLASGWSLYRAILFCQALYAVLLSSVVYFLWAWKRFPRIENGGS